jgi:hypothetical protein
MCCKATASSNIWPLEDGHDAWPRSGHILGSSVMIGANRHTVPHWFRVVIRRIWRTVSAGTVLRDTFPAQSWSSSSWVTSVFVARDSVYSESLKGT